MAYACAPALTVAPVCLGHAKAPAHRPCVHRSAPSSHNKTCHTGLSLAPRSTSFGLRAARVTTNRSTRARKLQCTAAALPAALLFDCDGVLVDTERDGHRVTFNQAFKEKGLTCEWGVEEYGELVKIGGGKERMTKYFSVDHPDEEPWVSLKTPEEQTAYVKDMHLLKTGLFSKMIESGALPLRPGVARLVAEAREAGVTVAVCSTSNEKAVSTIVRVMLGEEVAEVMRVFAGDCVPKKKPSPDIYLLAATELGVDPARCVVVEDSHIGLQAAKSAGMKCIVTTSGYTADEDFSLADAVYPDLGDEGDVKVSLTEICNLL